ncbi:hypothetical protein ABZ135_35980 [Streptomyces sp. NPDC006339]|uniref:hypothetical protein n=1 Tax=Streptomyces sp. NPDC006339 TaxID=3156755 RepID=UPI0033AB3B2A
MTWGGVVGVRARGTVMATAALGLSVALAACSGSGAGDGGKAPKPSGTSSAPGTPAPSGTPTPPATTGAADPALDRATPTTTPSSQGVKPSRPSWQKKTLQPKKP